MSEVFETAIIEKRNVLNEIRANNLSLQELRFFSIYLSKINPRDEKTRIVKFPLADFQKIMGLGRMNIPNFKAAVDGLLTKVVHVPDENGGFEAFQLFKKCKVNKDDFGEWYVSIDAHDDALPLMFDFKERYFKYELWNALRLKSPNQIRMYEILKQYEHLGKREITVKDLRELLGIAETEYANRTGWTDFKRGVLDSCQKALKETTDICYTYERGKTGAGGKWLTIVFTISKNEPTNKQMSIFEGFEQYLPDPEPETEDNPERLSETMQKIMFFADDLTLKEAKEIYYTMQEAAIYEDIFASFKRIYQTAVNNGPANLKAYILTIIKNEKAKSNTSPKSKDDTSTSVDEYKSVINKFLY